MLEKHNLDLEMVWPPEKDCLHRDANVSVYLKLIDYKKTFDSKTQQLAFILKNKDIKGRTINIIKNL